jgi:rubrerythrin
MNPQSRSDVIEALHGEAFAYARYMLFAAKAEAEGESEIAELFRETARVELDEHFAEAARLLGLVGTTADNLRAAIAAESDEVETTYRHFVRNAEEAGETEAAALFAEIREDEIGHRTVLQDALARLERRASAQAAVPEGDG